MVQDYRQNQIDLVAADTTASQAVRLLQVLNGRAQDVQAITTDLYERAVLISFADYADAFRRVQEFLSFCDVIESKLEDMPPATREPILHEVTAIKVRAFHAMLRGIGAYLTVLERRGMINFFAQAVFLMQQDVLAEFRRDVLPNVPPQLIPENMGLLYDEVERDIKLLLDRCVDVPDFRFET